MEKSPAFVTKPISRAYFINFWNCSFGEKNLIYLTHLNSYLPCMQKTLRHLTTSALFRIP